MIPKSDTTKWNETWFRDLSQEAKLLYSYIWDHADGAGGWKIDTKAAGIAIGSTITTEIDDLISAGVAKILDIHGGSHLWLNRYCLQYVTLSWKYCGHRGPIRMIRFYELSDEPTIRTLFKSGDHYAIDKHRQKLNLDAVDKEQPGERDMFNAMTDLGIPFSWQDWRRLCQLCPKMDKKQVFQSMAQFIPSYLSKHIRKKSEPQKPGTDPNRLWKMAVDIAEYSEKNIIYNEATAESLLGKWNDERFDTWQTNKTKKAPKPL